ncbi:unnamed protein product [Calypogeia fissa]
MGVTMYALLPIMLLLQFSSLVAAVDIIFFQDPSKCSGGGFSFNSVGPNVCCAVSAKDGGSVLVTSAGAGVASKFFRGGACATEVGSGSGNTCEVGGQFTGASWFNARRRSLLGNSQTCNSQMKPTGVVYTEDGANGNWILKTEEAAGIYSHMQNIPDAEKAGWLQSHGATYTEL